MRRGTMLIVGLLLTSTAVPQAADARPLILKMLRGMTAPLGAVMGGGRHSSRRAAYHHHRRAVAFHRRPAPAAAAAVAGAAGAAAAGGGAAPSGTGRAAATGAADAQGAARATTGLAPSQDDNARKAGAEDARAAAPLQRNATLAVPDPEPRAGTGEPARTPMSSARFGTAGLLAWPTAYEDVIGFTLWPKEYGERLRVHGIGDVLSTAFAPGTAIAARTQQARAGDPNGALAPATCGSVDLTANDWPIAQITSAIELNDTQRPAFDQLKTALSDAVSSLK